MSTTRRLLIWSAIICAVALAGAGLVIQARLGSPAGLPYSIARQEVDGYSVLAESLAANGIHVRRAITPGVPWQHESRPRTLVLANPPPGSLIPHNPARVAIRPTLNAVLNEVEQGSRLVVLGHLGFEERNSRLRAPRVDRSAPLDMPFGASVTTVYKDSYSSKPSHTAALHADAAPPAWPGSFFIAPYPAWAPEAERYNRDYSTIKFIPDPNTIIWYKTSDTPIVMREPRGQGEIFYVLYPHYFRNHILQHYPENRRMAAWLFGEHPEIVFLEQHFQPPGPVGLVALARSYHLGPAYLLLIGLGALVLWRHAFPLVPPPPAAPIEVVPYEPTAGLETILRRSITPAELARHCVEEARAGASPAELARLELVPSPGNNPVAFHQTAVRTLHPRTSTDANDPSVPPASRPSPSGG